MLDPKTIDAIAEEIIRQMGNAPAGGGQKPGGQKDAPVPARPLSSRSRRVAPKGRAGQKVSLGKPRARPRLSS